MKKTGGHQKDKSGYLRDHLVNEGLWGYKTYQRCYVEGKRYACVGVSEQGLYGEKKGQSSFFGTRRREAWRARQPSEEWKNRALKFRGSRKGDSGESGGSELGIRHSKRKERYDNKSGESGEIRQMSWHKREKRDMVVVCKCVDDIRRSAFRKERYEDVCGL